MKYKKCFNCNSTNIETNEDAVLCKECGFYSTLNFKNLSEDFDEQPKNSFDSFMKGMHKIVKDLTKYDVKNELYWLPYILHIYPKAILYPLGNSVNNWKWSFAPYKAIDKDKIKDYPNPSKPGEFYEYILDIDNEVSYDNYIDALKNMEEFIK